MDNVNDVYFDGLYKDLWKAFIPVELTTMEVDFMLKYFNLNSSKKVLDIMCGYGRHAVALAEKGIEVTAIDNLPDYILEIRSKNEQTGNKINIIQDNIVNYSGEDEFDLVICMGNSLNFFPESDIKKILTNISKQLRNGGYILINSWTIMEIASRQFREKTWTSVDEIKILSDSKFCFNPTRIETENTMIKSDGSIEIKHAIDYVFSIAELNNMLVDAGFELKDMFSILGKKKFSMGDSRIYIVAQKCA